MWNLLEVLRAIISPVPTLADVICVATVARLFLNAVDIVPRLDSGASGSTGGRIGMALNRRVLNLEPKTGVAEQHARINLTARIRRVRAWRWNGQPLFASDHRAVLVSETVAVVC